MSLPGFTAEASLYKTSELYYLTGSFGQSNGAIHLAQISLGEVIFEKSRCYPRFAPRYCFDITPTGKIIRYVCGIDYLGKMCD